MITNITRRARAACRPHAGFTLVELLVALGLFTIVATIATAGFVNALKTQRQVASLISAESNVTLVMTQMSREERTGYLFCHSLSSNSATQPSSKCADPVTGQKCTISDSGTPAAPGTPSADIFPGSVTSANPGGDLAVWNCPALNYYTAQGAEVNYSLQHGQLMRSDSLASSTAPIAITGNNVKVKYLEFTLFGNLEGDHWTPRITISMGVAPSSTDPAVAGDVLQFQTTVSARQIDCTPGEGNAGC